MAATVAAPFSTLAQAASVRLTVTGPFRTERSWARVSGAAPISMVVVISLQVQRGQVQAVFARGVLGDVVSGVGVAHDAGGRVVPQHAFQTSGGFFGAVGDDDHA